MSKKNRLYEDSIKTFSEFLGDSSKTVVLSGAGISTESGLKDFRSSNGMWSNQNIMEIASLDGMMLDPETFVKFYRWRMEEVMKYKPNIAHDVLTDWAYRGILETIITQNVDGYHRLSTKNLARIIELHGDINWVHCSMCEYEIPSKRYLEDTVCPACGGMMRPSIVMFGEALDSLALRNAIDECYDADLLIVLGSSLTVNPTAVLPTITKEQGGRLVIVNRDETHVDGIADLVFNDTDISTVLKDVDKSLGTLI